MPLNLSNGQFKIYVGISMNDRRCRSESLFFAGVESGDEVSVALLLLLLLLRC